MYNGLLLLLVFTLLGCTNNSITGQSSTEGTKSNKVQRVQYKEGSWQHFLQHLPTSKKLIVDYTGNPVDDQSKGFAVVNYDVGKKDLQQCADALMRLRAEYLFGQKRFDEIGFHFTSGHLYTYNDYCKGKRPAIRGNNVNFIQGAPASVTHESLRKYLDIVYTYAGTISLARELKDVNEFSVGTVIIKPGSPGHTCIIIDEGVTDNGEKVYKLAEGYTPAQSIYILSNPEEMELNPWYKLNKKRVQTRSYDFTSFLLKAFE